MYIYVHIYKQNYIYIYLFIYLYTCVCVYVCPFIADYPMIFPCSALFQPNLPGLLPFGAVFPLAQRLAFRPVALGSWCLTVQAAPGIRGGILGGKGENYGELIWKSWGKSSESEGFMWILSWVKHERWCSYDAFVLENYVFSPACTILSHCTVNEIQASG